jgi:DnaK suppressor protein
MMTPKRRRARLSRAQLKYFRTLLLEKRAELIADVIGLEYEANERPGDLSSAPDHLANHGTDEWDEDLLRSLAENERRLLFDIDDALARIEDGTYGLCEITGRPISKARLTALPWARRSIGAEREFEANVPQQPDDL